jgi:hypothetical protein
MQEHREVSALDAWAVLAVDEENTVHDPALARSVQADLLVLAHCSDEVAAGRLLFIRDQQAVLPHPSDLTLDQGEQVRDRVHPMKFEAVGGLNLGPVDTDEDDVGGGPDQSFEPVAVEADAQVDHRPQGSESLRPVKQRVTVELGSDQRVELLGEDRHHLSNIDSQGGNVVSGHQRHSQPVALPTHVRLIDVAQQQRTQLPLDQRRGGRPYSEAEAPELGLKPPGPNSRGEFGTRGQMPPA